MRKIRYPLYFGLVIHPQTVVLIPVKQKAISQEATLAQNQSLITAHPVETVQWVAKL
jgi:hypothetical protein